MRTTSEETKAVTDPSSHSSTLKAFSFACTELIGTHSAFSPWMLHQMQNACALKRLACYSIIVT